MKPKTLKQFKSEVRRLHRAYASVVVAYNGNFAHGEKDTFPYMRIIEVLLQNIGFDGSDLFGYDHDKELEKMYKKIEAVRAVDEYCKYGALTHFACNELDMLVMGFEREGGF